MLVVRDADARIACDDVVLHRQNGRPFHVDPGYLEVLREQYEKLTFYTLNPIRAPFLYLLSLSAK